MQPSGSILARMYPNESEEPFGVCTSVNPRTVAWLNDQLRLDHEYGHIIVGCPYDYQHCGKDPSNSWLFCRCRLTVEGQIIQEAEQRDWAARITPEEEEMFRRLAAGEGGGDF